MSEITIDPTKSIPVFYAGQSIFLTGATGFIGKVFIEKVLRSCPEIREIFLLIRPKKQASASERLEEILSLPLFDRLREERPSSFKKLIPISGKVNEKGLGLSDADRQTLIERVTIVIHAAASVKFNDSLKQTILNNTRSVRDVCMLAENMKNLVALIYVSTAFMNTDNPVIEEKLYPPKANWRKAIEIAESLDGHILDIFTSKYIGNAVNTYVFSKSLSEAIIQDYSTSLPCVIFRPSMISPSLKEPIPGWIDNIYGPIGMISGVLKGVMYIVYQRHNTHYDMIPVDIVIKSLLHVIWKRGLITATPNSTTLIFNCASGNMKTISSRAESTQGMIIERDIPLEGIGGTILLRTESYTLFYILTIIYHILPAILIDSILKLVGRQPMLLKIQKQTYVATCALRHYMFNDWMIKTTNTVNLNNMLPPDDVEAFKFHWGDVDYEEYMKIVIIGIKKYIFKEDTSPEAYQAIKTFRKRVGLFFTIVKICVVAGMLWMAYKWKVSSSI